MAVTKKAATKATAAAVTNTDAFTWANPYGGSWTIISNWFDNTTTAAATVTPGVTNAVSIVGGAGSFTNITGNGAASRLAISNDVLLWGTVAVGGAVTLFSPGTTVVSGATLADLELDGGASLTAGGIFGSGTVAVTGGSTLKTGSIDMGGMLLATGGSTVQVDGFLTTNAHAWSTMYSYYGGTPTTVAVDDASSIEIGTAGSAALGAITIDANRSAALSGEIYGNLVVNGTLAVEAGGDLSIDGPSSVVGYGDPFGSASSISGSGTLVLSEGSWLSLGVVDSAAILFNGPSASLELAVLPTGTISGFAAGDTIGLDGLATSLKYQQTTASLATLTLYKGSKMVGSLKLAGNYTSTPFHLSLDRQGFGYITLQTIGSAPPQPSLITGTVGYDELTATANNQTLTGLGNGDILNAGTFTGVVFKDTTAHLNGSTIQSFGLSDIVDLTDMAAASATATFVQGSTLTTYPYTVQPGTLTVTDGTHTAAISISSTPAFPAGYLSTTADGAGGTKVTYVTVNTDAYLFNAPAGGLYFTAANWQDTTTTATATAAPSYGNAVTIAGGLTYTNVTGNGFAASLTTSGDVLLWGSLTVGSKVSGVSGALVQTGALGPANNRLDLDGAASLALVGQAQVAGSVLVGGGSKLTAAGGLAFTQSSASLQAIGGSSAQFASVSGAASFTSYGYTNYSYYASAIGVDATSSIEIGTAGSAAAKGALTIDSGVTAALAGVIYGNVVVNGTLGVVGLGYGPSGSSATSLAIGAFGTAAPSISGSGTIELFYGTTLTLAGSDSAAILFGHTAPPNSGSSNSTETLTLAGSILPTGTISGFGAGDLIKLARTVTGLSYKQVTATSGTLTLTNGSATVGTLAFAGSYAASQFQLLVGAGGGTSSVAYVPLPSTTTGTQISTNNHSYAWANTSGGAWSNAANWTDTTLSGTAMSAPGTGNTVVISGSGSSPIIISGSGAAASLEVDSSTVFTGNLTVSGAVNLYNYSYSSRTGVTALAGGATLTAASFNSYAALQVGGGSSLTVSGQANLGGSLAVIANSSVQLSNLGSSTTISGTVAVDGTSRLEVGSSGGAAAGAITIDNGQSLSFSGGRLAAKLVVNGTLNVSGGMSGSVSTIEGFGGTIGAISGTGTIQVGGWNSTNLVLRAADNAAIAFTADYFMSGIMTLELAGPLPTGTISNFGSKDVIQVDQTVTGVSFKQTTASQGTLTLTNGAATVGTLTLAGTYASSLFHVDVAPVTGVATITAQAAPSSTGTGTASTGSDAYSWTGASGGSWTNAANWLDTTTSAPPTTVPGKGNAVTIVGPASAASYTTIGGNGAAASLSISGNVLLTGQIAVTGQVAVAPTTGQPTASLALDGGKLTAASATIAGTVSIGKAGSATVSGNATLTGGTLLALNGSAVKVGGLIGNGSNNAIAIDANSSIQIGSSTKIAGALTQAAGTTAALSGAIYGAVNTAGTLAVAGGGSLFIDMTNGAANDPYATTLPTISGSGTLMLTEGSTLGLGVADSVAISFAGPNATLELAALPTATITGFAAGDMIVVDKTVTGLSYTQGTGSGTLTLTNGATTVGKLTLAGTYNSSTTAFHLNTATDGSSATISLQSLGIAATQPTLIQGTAAIDLLTATATGQTLTGLGGGDTLSGGQFTGIAFKDLTANLNGDTIQNFVASDLFDFTDMVATKATATYAGGFLSVTDGTHAAKVGVGFLGTPSSGSFTVAADGAGGTKVTWH